MEQWRHPFVDRQNEGIEVSACRRSLLDMRGLLPQKVGKTMATIQDVSTGVPFFLKTARMYYIRYWFYPHTQNFLIIRLPERNDDSFSLVIMHKNIWRGLKT